MFNTLLSEIDFGKSGPHRIVGITALNTNFAFRAVINKTL